MEKVCIQHDVIVSIDFLKNVSELCTIFSLEVNEYTETFVMIFTKNLCLLCINSIKINCAKVILNIYFRILFEYYLNIYPIVEIIL